MVTFAEGTRSPDGTLHKFKKGPFKMSSKAGVRIVPVSVCGLHRWMPPSAVLPLAFPFRAVEIVIHPPVDTVNEALLEGAGGGWEGGPMKIRLICCIEGCARHLSAKALTLILVYFCHLLRASKEFSYTLLHMLRWVDACLHRFAVGGAIRGRCGSRGVSSGEFWPPEVPTNAYGIAIWEFRCCEVRPCGDTRETPRGIGIKHRVIRLGSKLRRSLAYLRNCIANQI